MNEELLRKIGLSEGEIKAYLALIESGPSPLNIIHEKLGVERRNLYDILNKLIEKGMVSYVTENKRRIFKAAHPDKIIHYLDQKEDDLKKIREETKKAIPELISKYDFVRLQTDAQIFRGIEGVKEVWEDTLNEKESYWIGSGNYIPLKYPHFYSYWTRKRIELKRKRHHLYRAEIRGRVVEHKLESHKFLPETFSANPFVIAVYGNKVANMTLGKELFVFVIENAEVAENFRKYFKVLWDEVAKD